MIDSFRNSELLIDLIRMSVSVSSSAVGGKIKYKIVLLGDQHVGKTSIIDRFINDRFESLYSPTIGIDFLVRNLTYKNKTYRLQLWDTAGQQRFKSLIPSYLKDSNLCILVYDLANLKSLQDVEKWMELYNQHKEYTAFSVIVGNKSDITTRQCTDEIIEDKIKNLKDVHHFQISAKTGEGVNELFHCLIDLINDKLDNIKIIDQIDQREDDREAGTAKPVITEDKIVTVKLAASDQENMGDKKKCC